MKKIYTLLFSALFAFGAQAQEFNFIPSSQEIQKLDNGWYKFNLEGTRFDVEIQGGKLLKGNIKWFDGAEYSGDLSGRNFSGKGSYTWPDGSKYEGAFKGHQRYGKGSLTDKDGTKWSGKWKENQKNGKGKIFDANGVAIKEGVWKAGELVSSKEL